MAEASKARRKYETPVLKKGPKLSEIAAVAKSLGGGGCWVARAAFGEQDIRWRVFREWLLDDAPAWFRAAYFRHGPAVGAWLEGRGGARRIVRSAMMVAIRRKLAGLI
jgi:hypothetical protein